MALNKLAEDLILISECSVKRHTGMNEYDPNTQTIYINILNDSEIAKKLKARQGRPTRPEWSWYHELGHAIFDIFYIHNDPEAQAIFGDFNAEYFGEDAFIESKQLRKNSAFITKYAQTHAEEDWADTFAMVVFSKGVPEEVTNKKLRRKAELVWEWIETIRREYS